jgi:predicted HTH transcriptional regulator
MWTSVCPVSVQAKVITLEIRQHPSSVQVMYQNAAYSEGCGWSEWSLQRRPFQCVLGQASRAGLLFFGQSPQDHIPQSEVVCVLFRETVGASRYADRKIVTGTLQDVIDSTEAFLDRYIAVGARIEGWKRIDIPEYSIEVLREAVINAVVHRDYSRRGERVRVFYYPDRVEVHSPGLLLPGITVEQMERGEVQSKLRNPALAGLLSTIPGYMEQIGSGVRFMLDETRRMELPAPQFREMSNSGFCS